MPDIKTDEEFAQLVDAIADGSIDEKELSNNIEDVTDNENENIENQEEEEKDTTTDSDDNSNEEEIEDENETEKEPEDETEDSEDDRPKIEIDEETDVVTFTPKKTKRKRGRPRKKKKDEPVVDETSEDDGTGNTDEDEGKDSKNESDSDDKIDYEKLYKQTLSEKEQLQKFHDKITSPFIANGKQINGIDDPDKIIRGLQMSIGFNEKMRSFKKYRPFLTPLKEKGIIDNPEKFNLLIDAMDGKEDAIKKLLKDSNINPIDLNIEDDFDYTPNDNTASEIDIAIEDLMDASKVAGVDNRVANEVFGTWDDNSLAELLKDKQSINDLVLHLSTGVYDIVTDRIREKQMFDPDEVFSSKPIIDQYRETVAELEKELLEEQKQEAQTQNNGTEEKQKTFFGSPKSNEPRLNFTEEEIQREMERILEEEKYQKKVEQNQLARKNRSRAASLSSTRKSTNKQEPQIFDPVELDEEDFEDLLASFMV